MTYKYCGGSTKAEIEIRCPYSEITSIYSKYSTLDDVLEKICNKKSILILGENDGGIKNFIQKNREDVDAYTLKDSNGKTEFDIVIVNYNDNKENRNMAAIAELFSKKVYKAVIYLYTKTNECKINVGYKFRDYDNYQEDIKVEDL